MSNGQQKLGIIAGGGGLPRDVAQAALDGGREVHLIGIEGEADESITAFSHDFIKWGEVGKLFAILKRENCADVVIIGHVSRPDLGKVRMDLGALKLLPFIMKLKVGGDDALLSKIAQLFEDKGHRVCSVLDVVPALSASTGVLGKAAPNDKDQSDIEKGVELIKAVGRFDVGQAVVVVHGHVIAVEGAEGTDQMLERCRHLKQWGRKSSCGVLIKTPKPNQDRRIDLPTIGPRTIELAKKAKLAGIAVAAGQTLIADRRRTLEQADADGLFLVGVDLATDAS